MNENNDQIRDELTESIKLDKVRMILSEFIPFDRNILEDISKKLMSDRPIEGEFVTMLMDEFPEHPTFVSEQRCNSIRVLDSRHSEFIACEASIQDPSDIGIEQREIVGIYLSHEGHIIYGAELVFVGNGDQATRSVSIDKLARILSDLSTDSSLMMDTLLTHHQRRLIDCIYKGHSVDRYKFVAVLAEEIHPLLEPRQYLDGEEYQNELEQILDNLSIAHHYPDDDTLILGGDAGIFFISKNWRKYESLASFYSLLRSTEMFVDSVFHRMSLLWDELAHVRRFLDRTSEGDYTVITKAQNVLSEASSNFTILKSIGGYLNRGFRMIHQRWEIASEEIDEKIQDLFNMDLTFKRLINRIDDIEVDIGSLESEVEGLQTLLSTQIEQQMRRVYSALRDNTHSTAEVIRANERSGNVLNVIELILSGTIAFDIVFALTGEYITDYAAFPTENPLIFFIIAIGLWVGISFFLKKGMDILATRVKTNHLLRIAINRPYHLGAVEQFLDEKEIVAVDEELQDDREPVRVLYEVDDIPNVPEVKVTLCYDRKNHLIQDVTIETPTHNVDIVRDRVMSEINKLTIQEDE